jgi:hypothetical protein
MSLSDLKSHAFFKNINWKLMDKGKVKPPTPELRKIEKSKIPMANYDSEDDDDNNSNESGRKEEDFGYEEVQFDENGERMTVKKKQDDDEEEANDDDITKLPNFTYIGTLPG